MDTAAVEYTDYLKTVRGYAQFPFRWNLKWLNLGRTLDIGCGIGRNLEYLDGVGIDPNPASVRICRERGLQAFTPDEFDAPKESFDSLLFAHVLEHLGEQTATNLVGDFLPYLRHGGKVALITPQQKGFASDTSHVSYLNLADLELICQANGLHVIQAYSFPFPSFMGKVFRFNESIAVARKVTYPARRTMPGDF